MNGPAPQAASPARSRSRSLSPPVSFPCRQDPKRVVSFPWPSCRLRWVREPSSLNKQQRCLPGPSLHPQPLALQENFRPNSHSAPAPRPTEFQPPESSPGVPPTTALTELLLGGRRALETGGTHRAGTGKTLAQPKRGWEGNRGNRATGVGRSLGHAMRCGVSFRATSLGTQVHAGPPSDPGWWPPPHCLDVASQTVPLHPFSPAQDHVGR